MKRPNIENTVAAGTSVLTIIAPKFCCWSTAIAAISGGSSYLAWVYPMRPYLFAFSFLSVGYSFYKIYKPKRVNETNCKCNIEKNNFFSSKWLAWITLIFVIIMFVVSYFIK